MTGIKSAVDNEGSKFGQYNLGLAYYYGRGIEKSYMHAFNCFTRSSKQDYPDAYNRIGQQYYKRQGVSQNTELAIWWYQKAIDAESSNAMLSMGKMYEEGAIGLDKSYTEALHWYKKSLDCDGSSTAQHNIGVITTSKGVWIKTTKKHYTGFEKLLKTMVNLNLKIISKSCTTMVGVKQDYVKALDWYTKAADQGDAHAQCNIGVVYAYGNLNQSDHQE
jgi:TPR repeat protein